MSSVLMCAQLLRLTCHLAPAHGRLALPMSAEYPRTVLVDRVGSMGAPRDFPPRRQCTPAHSASRSVPARRFSGAWSARSAFVGRSASFGTAPRTSGCPQARGVARAPCRHLGRHTRSSCGCVLPCIASHRTSGRTANSGGRAVGAASLSSVPSQKRAYSLRITWACRTRRSARDSAARCARAARIATAARTTPTRVGARERRTGARQPGPQPSLSREPQVSHARAGCVEQADERRAPPSSSPRAARAQRTEPSRALRAAGRRGACGRVPVYRVTVSLTCRSLHRYRHASPLHRPESASNFPTHAHAESVPLHAQGCPFRAKFARWSAVHAARVDFTSRTRSVRTRESGASSTTCLRLHSRCLRGFGAARRVGRTRRRARGGRGKQQSEGSSRAERGREGSLRKRHGKLKWARVGGQGGARAAYAARHCDQLASAGPAPARKTRTHHELTASSASPAPGQPRVVELADSLGAGRPVFARIATAFVSPAERATATTASSVPPLPPYRARLSGLRRREGARGCRGLYAQCCARRPAWRGWRKAVWDVELRARPQLCRLSNAREGFAKRRTSPRSSASTQRGPTEQCALNYIATSTRTRPAVVRRLGDGPALLQERSVHDATLTRRRAEGGDLRAGRKPQTSLRCELGVLESRGEVGVVWYASARSSKRRARNEPPHRGQGRETRAGAKDSQRPPGPMPRAQERPRIRGVFTSNFYSSLNVRTPRVEDEHALQLSPSFFRSIVAIVHCAGSKKFWTFAIC
ncbi:hypothetical protein FB451DRAFT_1481825 [Mycena latifolia]|nr:hypothetical protein FB451DRAFT_1481825 [Mycena latifolia]